MHFNKRIFPLSLLTQAEAPAANAILQLNSFQYAHMFRRHRMTEIYFLYSTVYTVVTTPTQRQPNLNIVGDWTPQKLNVSNIAKLSLNSTQLQLQLRLGLALFPAYPATHPSVKVVSKEVRLKTFSRLL